MDYLKLNDVTIFVRNGATIKQNKENRNGYPITRIETLSNDKFNYDRLGYASIFDEKYSDYYLKDGDVLLSHINSEKFLGRSVMYKDIGFGNIIHGMNLLNIRFKTNYLPKYFEYYARSSIAKRYFIKNTKHAVNQASISSTAIKNMPIPNVTLDVQKKVVISLNIIDNAINSKQKQFILLDELIKSRFIEMFETIDLSEQRSNWKELGLVSKIYTGTTPSTKEPKNWDGDILWITPAEMNQDTFYVYDTVRKITEIGLKSKSLDLMPVNTVLLSTRAPIGKVGIVGKPMACNQGFKNFECSSEVNPVFLYTLLKNNTDYLNSLGSGTTFLEVSKSRISKMLIPVPSIELQNQFESYIKLIDKLKFIVQEQIKNLQELFDKKMDEYFGE